jgi:AcrR family transcriptional regulator
MGRRCYEGFMDTSLKKKPKQERSRFLFDSIIQAAQNIYSHSQDISINKIAEKAGVSIGSLYQYFPNKDAIIDEIGRRTVGERIAEFEANLEHIRHLPLQEGMEKLIEFVCDMYFKHPLLLKTIFTKFPGWKQTTGVQKYREQVVEMFVNRLNRSEQSTLRSRNHKLTAFVMMTAVMSNIESAVLRYPEISAEDLKAELSALCRGYLFKRDQSGAVPATDSEATENTQIQ